jgi:hypothetical protein
VSSVSDLRDHLNRLEDAVAGFGPAAETSPALALMQRGLTEVRDDVRQQYRDARRAQLSVVLDGLPVVGHEIRVDALARLLHSLQESVSSVAQALTGKATSRAAIPGPLRESTGLSLAAVFPGSFGAVLRGPAPDDRPEQPMFDFVDETPSLLDDAVGRVLTIIELAGSDSAGDSPIIDAVLPLGSRTFKHLTDLSSAIVDEEMTASLEWSSPSGAQQQARLTRQVAQRLDDILGRNKMTERDVVLHGRLGTASDLRNRVELETDTGEIVAARVIEEVVPLLGQFFTRRVIGTFQMTTVRSQVTGLERDSYVLIGLADADEQTDLTEM